ncbi:MAG: VCBS repeat-containing protein [Pirellulales bacterium]|nr:VCBS repeat-containing protein [Pirellulales bacterium]
MRWVRLCVPLGCAALAAAALGTMGSQGTAAQQSNGDLAPPVRLEAADGVIDAEIGHAAPYLADIDGDGLADLLVGQFGGGKLRWYRNVGTSGAPKFAGSAWVKAAGKPAATTAG